MRRQMRGTTTPLGQFTHTIAYAYLSNRYDTPSPFGTGELTPCERRHIADYGGRIRFHRYEYVQARRAIRALRNRLADMPREESRELARGAHYLRTRTNYGSYMCFSVPITGRDLRV